MNIFYLDVSPTLAAQYQCDKHVVKMIVETAQLMSTAHRVLDGKLEVITPEYDPYRPDQIRRKRKFWSFSDDRETALYLATHVNHPSAIWVRESNNNYNWLLCHFISLMAEYTFRYGKLHKTNAILPKLMQPPKNIPITYFKAPPQCMPDEFKTENTVEAYRNYYRTGKAHLLKYTKREKPQWL